jgi:hypothetical protein
LIQFINSFQAMSEPNLNVYETCDPSYLLQLRGQAGMEVVQLARIACLSVAQVKCLEAGEDDLFYSLAIKRQAYKRVLMILGAPPPVTFAEPQRDEAPASPIPADVNESLNQIADLTTQPVNDWTSSVSAVGQMGRQKIMIAVIAAAATLGGVAALDSFEGEAWLAQAFAPSSETVNKTVRTIEAIPAVAAPVVVDSAPEKAPEKAPTDVVSVPVRGSSACAFSSDPGPEVFVASPKKEGRFVYVLSPTDTSVCVVDGNKQANTLQLKAGEGRSIYGSAPWQISGNNLTDVQIFFQGWRASLPEGAVQKIVLVEKTPTP